MFTIYLNSLLSLVGADSGAQATCDPVTGATCDTGLPVVHATGVQINQILGIAFGIIAAIAVLMIVLAGLHYITSQGNPQEVAKARDTIIFALIGLVIAIFAESIVWFVVGKL